MSKDRENAPNFRTINKGTRNAQLMLLCSRCSTDIRILRNDELIDMRRGYFCKEHDDGTVRLNMPLDVDPKDEG